MKKSILSFVIPLAVFTLVAVLVVPGNVGAQVTIPTIQVVSPNGGEHYNVGDTIKIIVRTSNLPSLTKVQVALSSAGGMKALNDLNDRAGAIGDEWTFLYKVDHSFL
ncbi:MAG: hypothetical protein A3C79_03365 [Candidatus Taylorbacteria bacterium RIFCSPHIGHO2_02_FULL_45_28]|nr:MAG: hypothetical protein A2830_01080 [Candidatus Taylorbacteria bacterium RIFCSPHIGHO2_01_FULL_44_110]OHA24996.1 MAG: hypothetical protein A3C79_03365 [Candidatus Taylorbacteria bacterium RIFCSPHIGHO2_02_FULL_45_28]OHA32757.1 MAG: hypothetical protein A3A23_00645 [Candidatus Taylorbacteria bacterium RIFCSPLOWO2_01_FULL_45_59]OHA39052.1 MAG: hypothetical protein A3I98_00230 [Candidatus Taylorbacteria bacterium RIFCSPLOWO2_02_FULL_45_10b]OHA44611.1 MAG: hypothetical protein A3G04_02225 [Candi